MYRILLAALFAAFSLGQADSAQAQQILGDTQVPYSADRVVQTQDGKSYVGRVYATPGKLRQDQDVNGIRGVAIVRADQRVAWVELPDLRIYTEFAFPAAINDLTDPAQLGSPIGTETVSGIKARKYRVQRSGNDGSSVDGFAWISDEGIVVKLDGSFSSAQGKVSHASYLLSNIRIGPQPDSLFDLSAGMNRLPPEAVNQLLNMRMGVRKG